jgi:nickel/cobalt transporter (NicO) family protein
VTRASKILIFLMLLPTAVVVRPPAAAAFLPTFGCPLPGAANAPVKNPFAIAGGESSGAASGFAGTILAWQNKFHQELQKAAKALKEQRAALWTLFSASLAYGVFHAAGPGHGKAVLASYMIASETALRRGVVLAALAALLQGFVAIAIVGTAAALLGLTALEMRGVADLVETASYGAIALLGAALALRKGAGLLVALRAPAAPVKSPSGFFCESVDPLHRHTESCGCANVDPASLEGRFSLAGAAGVVVAAGLRPCSGAILVLAFTLAQGAFLAGAGAVLLMSAGTAITTGALAGAAVYAKKAAQKWSALGDGGGALAFRGAEFLASLVVLLLGLALLAGARCGGGA